MSQLDISIVFSHFFSCVLCFYFFSHILSIVLVKYWYNDKLRQKSYSIITNDLVTKDFFIKKILKL